MKRCNSYVGGLAVWVGTGPLSFESTVEVIQFVCSFEVFQGVGGFGFAAGDHPQPLPD